MLWILCQPKGLKDRAAFNLIFSSHEYSQGIRAKEGDSRGDPVGRQCDLKELGIRFCSSPSWQGGDLVLTVSHRGEG